MCVIAGWIFADRENTMCRFRPVQAGFTSPSGQSERSLQSRVKPINQLGWVGRIGTNAIAAVCPIDLRQQGENAIDHGVPQRWRKGDGRLLSVTIRQLSGKHGIDNVAKRPM